MGGDRMGATLSSFTKGGEHRNFSRSLAEFAIAVVPIIEEFAGRLIYAGGDDVLAIVPAKEAVTCAAKLSNLFSKNVKNKGGEGLTASAGIAIGHSSVPLQDLVHAAHAAESRAKKTYGRNALAISIYKRSGEILEWGCKWGSPALEIYKTLSELDRKEKQIGGFPYKLAGLLQPYAIEGKLADGMHEIVMAEFKHAISQTEDMRGELDEQQVEDYLTQCGSKRGEDFLTLFLAEAFINRPPKEN
jgi:CRISPR-associated protein Cmr2